MCTYEDMQDDEKSYKQAVHDAQTPSCDTCVDAHSCDDCSNDEECVCTCPTVEIYYV